MNILSPIDFFSKIKISTNFAILWLNMFWDKHHCDCITKLRKKKLDKGASCQAQGMELDEAKISLEKPM